MKGFKVQVSSFELQIKSESQKIKHRFPSPSGRGKG